jgi:serine phosphatase RsbU (regulator of sigma subunit)
MPRRTGALPSPASPASLALALSILGTLAVLHPSAADSAKRPPDARRSEPAVSAPVAPAKPVEPAAQTPAASRQAERAARRRERPGAPAGPASATTEAGASAGTPAEARRGPAPGSAAPGRRHGSRHAPRAGEGAAAGTEGAAAPQAADRSQALSAREKARREREREQRKREGEERRREGEERRQKSGHLNRRERAAREAAEARAAEASKAVNVPKAATAVVTAVPTVAALPPAPALGLGAPALAAEHAVRPTAAGRSRRRARRGAARAHAVTAPAVPAPAAGGLAASVTTRRSAPRPRSTTVTSARRAAPSSPLVTTVTRIIGVIPAFLWLLIGALGLAAAAFAIASRLSARRADRLDRQRRELLADVGLLQAALLPELPARLGPLETTASYRPASGPGAGGDFYDVFALAEGKVAVIVGDVSGHGREALPHTTLLRYTLRAYLEAGSSPREALRAAAPALERQLGGSFATVVLATYDPRERLLVYACAGHPHPILTGLAHGAPIIACSAPPIGAGRPTGTRQTTVEIPGETVACFYTDGVIEARTGGELYGQGRLAAALDGLGEEQSASALLDRVRAGTDRRPDDMAACLLKILGGEGRPTIRSEEIELDGREAGRARTRRFLQAAGVAEEELDGVLDAARAVAADHGSALLTLRMGEGRPGMTLTHDNVAPLRARAIARTQEVAL